MNIIAIVGAVIIAILIFNSLRQQNPEAEACAKDIIALIKQNKAASASDVAEILKTHRRTERDASEVLKLIRPKLIQAGIRKEDHNEFMHELSKAKRYLPSAYD